MVTRYLLLFFDSKLSWLCQKKSFLFVFCRDAIPGLLGNLGLNAALVVLVEYPPVRENVLAWMTFLIAWVTRLAFVIVAPRYYLLIESIMINRNFLNESKYFCLITSMKNIMKSFFVAKGE